MSKQHRQEIMDAIHWYEAHGYDWGDVVTFLGLKFSGRLEAYMNPWRRVK